MASALHPTSAPPSSLSSIISSHRPDLESYATLYKHLHSHPELSLQEKGTSATAASKLQSISPSFKITSHIGGYGLVGVFENGVGKTVLLRADTDALPVEEKTGLPYASKVVMKDNDGLMKPVMHACGHDMHVTSMLAAAELLVHARDEWSGTLIIVFQPAEERGAGAKAMVEDGLYNKNIIPIPDVVLGQHVMPYPAGVVGVKRGLMASAADSFKVTIFGRGGHASQPHRTIDPVVVAAGLVVRLQTIVSREAPPGLYCPCYFELGERRFERAGCWLMMVM
jgi:amidohydrolase